MAPPSPVTTSDDEPIAELPIDGVLDLHTVHPRDVHWLVPDYLAACRRKGILHVRIVHGKGSMVMQKTVHSLLAKERHVASFRLADESGGGWGATVVVLREE